VNLKQQYIALGREQNILKAVLLVLTLLLFNNGNAQTARYEIRVSEPSFSKQLKRKTFADSVAFVRELTTLVQNMQQKGYLLAQVQYSDSAALRLAFVTPGVRFEWLYLSKGNVPPEILNAVAYRERFYKGSPFHYRYYLQLRSAILQYVQNRGYPFASLGLDSLEIKENKIKANLHYQQGTYIRFDTLIISGEAEGKVRSSFLRNYLRIYPGEPFSQAKMDEASALLEALPYIELEQPLDAVFKYDRAYPLIKAKPTRANQFDGVIGLLPNQERPGQMLITGQVNLRLENMFNSGKRLQAAWQRLRPSSQVFNIEYEHPSLLSTRLDVGLRFNLLKEDTTFLNITRGAQVAYAPGKNFPGRLHAFTRIQSSTITDTAAIISGNEAIRLANTRFLAYGMGYRLNTALPAMAPRKGWQLQTEAGIGNKNTSVRQATGADSLAGRIPQWFVTGTVSRFFRTGKQATLLARVSAGWMQSRNLFFNDMFRLGGLNSIRGFNENTFFASSYLIATIEYRLYFEKSSYLFMFADQSGWEYKIPGQVGRDTPFGTGLGMNFSTKGGIFTFVYAMGRSTLPEQSFSINRAKIHFGYVSQF
jgi:outer membrane protein assembly factor BamA